MVTSYQVMNRIFRYLDDLSSKNRTHNRTGIIMSAIFA